MYSTHGGTQGVLLERVAAPGGDERGAPRRARIATPTI